MNRIIVGGGVIGASVALALLIFWVLASSAEATAAWNANCAALGGHVADQHQTGTGIGFPTSGKGGPTVIVTSSTTYYCLSASGGILDIR